MKIAIAIATTGRRAILDRTIDRLERQSPPPEAVVVVGANEADIEGLASKLPLTLATAEKGTCRQRNKAMSIIGDSADIIVFMDDDFVPAAGFVAGVGRVFSDHPDLVVASGEIIADGAKGPGLSFEEADALVAAAAVAAPKPDVVEPRYGAYGCNLAIRRSAAQGLTFDENLPLYGWQEDIDFSGQMRPRGRVAWTNAFAGVHLGTKVGRTSGRRLGYSQVVNPIYLVRKGTFPWPPAMKLLLKNLAANVLLSFGSDPYVDRRGRLVGNLIGVGDILMRRAHPSRILEL